MKNKVKSTFRSSLIVGLIPLSMALMIVGFAVWAISHKNKSEVEQSNIAPEVVHDTVYVKVNCQKNHFECPPNEARRKKNPVVVEVTEVNLDTTE